MLFLTNVTLFLTNVTLSLKTTLSSSVFVSGTPRDPLFLFQDHRVILWGQVCSSGRPNFFQRTIGSSFFLVGARARRPMFFYPQVVTVTSNFEKDQTLTSNFVFFLEMGRKTRP